MTRAKIMLIAIGVLATVGGALAFKAQNFTTTRYCTTNVSGAKCKLYQTSILTTNVTPNNQYWYKVTNQNSCPNAGIDCEALSTSFTDQ